MEIVQISPPKRTYYSNYAVWKVILLVSMIFAAVEETNAQLEKPSQQRFIRSPQMPPSVTARRPSSFEEPPQYEDELDVKPGVQSAISAPPSVISRAKSKENNDSSKEPSTYFKASNNLPVSPFIAAKTRYDVDETAETQILVLHTQSDESENTQKAKSRPLSSSSLKSAPNKSTRKKSEPPVKPTTPSQIKFSNYLEALKSVKVSPPKAASILKRKGVAFAEFINFIEGGATRDQILQILYVPDPTKMQTKPDLTNYFTEIVHEVPAQGSYKNYELDKPQEDKKKQKSRSKDSYSKKKNKHFKKHKQSKHQKYHGDINDIPSKDSPMIAHRRDPSANEGTASILSVSIEAKEKKPPPPKKVEDHPRKNVLLPTKPRHKQTASERLETVEPADLRVVFPIQGILLFCSVVGGLALFITLSLAIYTALSCSKGEIENTYTMNTADKPEEIEC